MLSKKQRAWAEAIGLQLREQSRKAEEEEKRRKRKAVEREVRRAVERVVRAVG